MSHLQYFAYPGFGERVQANMHYSPAVRIPSPTGDIIQISGQGGWDQHAEPLAISPDWATQIDQTFENVDVALKAAGGQGWSQVYNIHAYFSPLDAEQAGPELIRNLRKWCPNHKPCLTAVGVEKLWTAEMKIEIEVSAHLG